MNPPPPEDECGAAMNVRTPEALKAQYLAGNPWILWETDQNPTGSEPMWGEGMHWSGTDLAALEANFQTELRAWSRARNDDDRFALLVTAILKAQEKLANDRAKLGRTSETARMSAASLYNDVVLKFLHVADAGPAITGRFSKAIWGDLGACATRAFRNYLKASGQVQAEAGNPYDPEDVIYIAPNSNGGPFEKLAAAVERASDKKIRFFFSVKTQRHSGIQILSGPNGERITLPPEMLAEPLAAIPVLVSKIEAYRESSQNRSPFDITFCREGKAADASAAILVSTLRNLEGHIERISQDLSVTPARDAARLSQFPDRIADDRAEVQGYLTEAEFVKKELEAHLHQLVTDPVLRVRTDGIELQLRGSAPVWSVLYLLPGNDERRAIIWKSGTGKNILFPVKANHFEGLYEGYRDALLNPQRLPMLEIRPLRLDFLWRALWAIKRQLEVTIGHFTNVRSQLDRLHAQMGAYLERGDVELAALRLELQNYRPLPVERTTLRDTDREVSGRDLPAALDASLVPVAASPTLVTQLLKLGPGKARADLVGHLGVDAILRYAAMHGWAVEDRSLDNFGYDLRLFKPRLGLEFFVEVKARSAGGGTFSLTAREARFAYEHRDRTLLGLVVVDAQGNPRVTLRRMDLSHEPDPAAVEITFDIERFLESRPELDGVSFALSSRRP